MCTRPSLRRFHRALITLLFALGHTAPAVAEPPSPADPSPSISGPPVSNSDAPAEPDGSTTTAPRDGADARTLPPSSAEPGPRMAPDVDLSEPVVDPGLAAPGTLDQSVLIVSPPVVSPDEVSTEREPLVLLGEEVAPGTSARLSWSPRQGLAGLAVPTPVLVVNGTKEGKTLCLTAAVHGDELNGIEIVRRVLYDLDPELLSGAVIGVPIVNLQGFRRNSRYLADRRDLNRHFPGNPAGSSAARIAYSFFNEVVKHCDALVDVHTGSFLRTNLPQLRADMRLADVAALTRGFGATAVLHRK